MVWKNRQTKGGPNKGKGSPKGKGKGKPRTAAYQRTGWNRYESSPLGKEKGICHNYSRGTGFCKYGANCKYKHEGPTSIGGKRAGPSLMVAPVSKKARKKLTSLIMKDIRSALKEKDKRGEEATPSPRGRIDTGTAEDHVYRIIKGVPSVIISNI